MTTNNPIYLIGNTYELDNLYYKQNQDFHYLPLNNIIINYVPLNYLNSSAFNQYLKEHHIISDDDIIENNIDIEKIMIDISNLNAKYKAFNNSYIFKLTIIIIFIWLIITIFILRYFFLKYNIYYTYLLLIIVIILLVISVLWSLYSNKD